MRRIIVLLAMVMTMHAIAQSTFPILSNFRIENSQTSRVYFDSSEPITASSAKGFIISGKSISGVTISSGRSTGHYFSVTSPFNFWDNNTIRYEGGSNFKNKNGLVVSEFTLTYIKNQIAEPEGNGKIFYVSTTGNDNNNGLKETTAWRTIRKAGNTAMAGDIVYIKAGNYGGENVKCSNSGTKDAPIKFIGYKSKIDDLNDYSYYKYGSGNLDGSRAPLIQSKDRKKGIGWEVSGRSYIMIKNIQIEGFEENLLGFSSPNNIFFDNLVSARSGEHNVMLTTIGGHHLRFTNTLSFNGMVSAFMIGGDFNAILNCKTYADEPQKDIAMDYHVYLYGKNNIVYRHFGQHMGNLSHPGHGISLKSSGNITEFNLVENCEMNNINGALEFRHSDVKYNVAKNFKSDGGLDQMIREVSYSGMVQVSILLRTVW